MIKLKHEAKEERNHLGLHVWGTCPTITSNTIVIVLIRLNLRPTDGAPVLSFEPLLDAFRVELVEAWQRQKLIPLAVVCQADCALKIIGLQLLQLSFLRGCGSRLFGGAETFLCIDTLALKLASAR